MRKQPTTTTHKSIIKLEATKSDKASSQAAKKNRIPFKEQQNTIQIIINNIVRELEVQKANNGGRMPWYDAISEVILAKQIILPWLLTIYQVKNQLKKAAQLEFNSTGTTSTACAAGGAAAATPFILFKTTTLSTLTQDSEYGNMEHTSPPPPPHCPWPAIQSCTVHLQFKRMKKMRSNDTRVSR